MVLIMFHVVGQLVPMTGLGGKMLREEFAGFLDAVEDALGEAGFLEMAGHLGGNVGPEGVAATLMHASVADDGEFAHAGRDVDEDAIAIRGFVHAKARELRLSGGDGVVGFMPADEDADFAGGEALGFLDRGNNLLVVQLF